MNELGVGGAPQYSNKNLPFLAERIIDDDNKHNMHSNHSMIMEMTINNNRNKSNIPTTNIIDHFPTTDDYDYYDDYDYNDNDKSSSSSSNKQQQVAWSALSHNLNQSWLIVHWPLG